MEKVIKTGVGVMLLKDNKVLLGHRVNKAKDTGGIYEPDSWTFPGGKQEYNETVLETAIRETKEETNLDLKELYVYTATDEFQPDRHFVTIGVISSSYEGELKVMEPDKINEWKWFDLNDLPNNIYTPSKNMIDEYKKRGNIK
jgi:ADP-ribose pyrophosphatase YjhB (NUDIX family)